MKNILYVGFLDRPNAIEEEMFRDVSVLITVLTLTLVIVIGGIYLIK